MKSCNRAHNRNNIKTMIEKVNLKLMERDLNSKIEDKDSRRKISKSEQSPGHGPNASRSRLADALPFGNSPRANKLLTDMRTSSLSFANFLTYIDVLINTFIM